MHKSSIQKDNRQFILVIGLSIAFITFLLYAVLASHSGSIKSAEESLSFAVLWSPWLMLLAAGGIISDSLTMQKRHIN